MDISWISVLIGVVIGFTLKALSPKMGALIDKLLSKF